MEIEYKKETEEVFKISDSEEDDLDEVIEPQIIPNAVDKIDYTDLEFITLMNDLAPPGASFHDQLGEFVLGDQLPVIDISSMIETKIKEQPIWDNSKWIEVDSDYELPVSEKIEFSRKNLNIPLSEQSKPHEIFSYFFSPDIFESLMHETNNYANISMSTSKDKKYLSENPHSRMKNWKEISDPSEIQLYIASLIYSGIVKLPSIFG